MLNFRRLISVTLLVLAMLAASSWWSGAQSGSETANGRLSDTAAVIADDVVTAGEAVHVNATVKGDVAAAGADVTIAGPIDGYVLGAGRTVRIDAPVGNDVWAAGETVEIDSTIGNNVMVAGRVVHLGRGSVVGEDARLAGDRVTVEGRVERDLRIGADVADIRGPVAGTVRVRAARVRIEPGAVIGGDLIVRSPRRPEVSPGAQISGEIRHEEAGARLAWAAWPLVWLVTFAALFVLALVVTVLAPARARRAAGMLRMRPGRSMAIGAIVLVLAPLGIVALAITLIGIPLAAAMLALYLLFLMLSGICVSQGVGSWILDRAHRSGASRWAQLALGVLVVSLAITMPLVGWILALAVVAAGTGALLLEERALSEQP
jgi:hypothetical protein